ncbi:helix-turn-helix domain-containing protein [Lentibacillus salicampi]|nr:helix-turn-helix transcriptional regulator [Lentibacillus salicampi]
MTRKYYLNFDGTLGEFIKQHRKAKKINARDLSFELGKGAAYIYQIESERNKNPDYDNVYKIFKYIGIDEDKIEDYLESFGLMSPEREQELINKQMQQNELTYDEYQQHEENEKEIRNSHPEYFINTDDELLKEIINDRLEIINSILKEVSLEKTGEGFKLVKNIEQTLTNMKSNKKLYMFMQRLFDNNLSLLNEDSLVKVLNELYKEMNEAEKENAAWGEPIIKQSIDKL